MANETRIALPPQIRKIVDLIGMAEAIVLLKERGGAELYIPLDADRATVLSEIISRDAVVALCASDLAGQTLNMPMAHKLLTIARNNEIREASAVETKTQIARRYNMTVRHVRNICEGLSALETDDNPTGDLFA